MTYPHRQLASVFSTVLLLIGLLLSLTSCSGAGAEESTDTLTIADQDYETQVPFQGSGAGKGAGYDIKFAQFNGGEDVIAALESGAADVGVTGEAPPILAVGSGVNDLALVALSASPGVQSSYYLAAQPGSGIDSVADLKGKKVAYPGGTGREMVYKAILDKAGLDPQQDVHSIDMSGSEVAPAFASGSVDAAILEGGEYFGVGSPPLLETGQGYTNNMRTMFVRRDTLDDPDTARMVRDFIGRAVQSQNWVEDNPEKFIELNFVKQQKLSQQQGRQLLADTGVAHFYPIDGEVTRAYQDVADQLHDTGVIEAPVDVQRYLDPRFNATVAEQNRQDDVTLKPIPE